MRENTAAGSECSLKKIERIVLGRSHRLPLTKNASLVSHLCRKAVRDVLLPPIGNRHFSGFDVPFLQRIVAELLL